MKAPYRFATRTLLALFVLMQVRSVTFGQGKVVLNEYLPWPSNGCGVTSEFIELLNYGPGPMNIGCYIVTTGKYSITIPANTILLPGDFYLLSGQNTIAAGCANIDSAVHPDLNWTTCNCTSSTIPTTGDGLMTDGGSGNTQVVLFDPNLNVVDAVVRSAPGESTLPLTTSTMGGNCTAKSFNLGTMGITYESLGMSDGRGNSNARRIDGDCGWVKETKQSAHATNNMTGNSASISYNLTYTQPLGCPKGSVVIGVFAASYAGIFPMNWTLGYDSNNNGIFDANDTYTSGTDNSPTTIPIDSLLPGKYNVTVASAQGCNLWATNFTILDCNTVLSVKLLSFEGKKIDGMVEYKWSLDNTESLVKIDIEKSNDGINFLQVGNITAEPRSQGKKDFRYLLPDDGFSGKVFLRLSIHNKDSKVLRSSVVVIDNKSISFSRIWPNPVHNELKIEINSEKSELINYKIFDVENHLWADGNWRIQQGANTRSVPLTGLPNGYYRLFTNFGTSAPPTVHSFIKL